MGTEKSKGMTIYSLSGHVAQPGPVRGAAGHHAAPAAGPGRRHPGRSPAEVLDPGRVLDADADRRAPGHPAGLRGRGQREVDARHQGAAVLRRDHLGGAHRAALDRVLQARVLRQVHPVPRGHLVAGADPEADGGRPAARRATSRSCSTCARTSSAARSAPSATGPRRRSARPSSTSGSEFEQAMHTPAWELFPYERSTIFVREPVGARRCHDRRRASTDAGTHGARDSATEPDHR